MQFFTTGPCGDIFLDIKENNSDRELILKCNIINGKIRKPYQEAWIDGNTSIGHISELINNNDDPLLLYLIPKKYPRPMMFLFPMLRLQKTV